jgi:hypothetical protein
MMDTLELRSSQQAIDAVNLLKTAILQSQARAANAVNQEQLALYYGVGRFLSLNTRNKNWGAGMIKSISQRLRSEIPGLRGFGETNLRNMRLFYEAWSGIESNSSVTTDKFGYDHWIDLLFYNRDLRRLVVFELKKGKFKTSYLGQLSSYLRILNDDDRREGEEPPIGIILCKSADKSYVEYVMQDFRQPMGVATYKTADEMDAKLLEVLPSKEQLEKLLGD